MRVAKGCLDDQGSLSVFFLIVNIVSTRPPVRSTGGGGVIFCVGAWTRIDILPYNFISLMPVSGTSYGGE